MPLLLPTLTSDLVDIYNKGKKGNPFPAAVGIKTGKAYVSYVSAGINACLLYTSPSPRDQRGSRMPSSA